MKFNWCEAIILLPNLERGFRSRGASVIEYYGAAVSFSIRSEKKRMVEWCAGGLYADLLQPRGTL